jgi:hypothetical protein
MNIAICLLCVEPNDIHVNFMNRISGNYTKIMLCDSSTSKYSSNNTITFLKIDDQISSNLGYKNSNCCIPKNPSAWDKAFYYFCEVNTSFDYVWIIEDDVFIPSINTISYLDNTYGEADLLSKENCLYTKDSTWTYSKEIIGKHQEPWYSSMVCATRLSNKLFQKIKEYVYNHHTLFFIETMINTIAMHNNLLVKNPIELSSIMPKPEPGKRFRTCINGKIVWVPNLTEFKINNLYHPFKDINLHDTYRID